MQLSLRWLIVDVFLEVIDIHAFSLAYRLELFQL